MLKLIKLIFTFINGFVTGVLVLFSTVGLWMSYCYCLAARNSGLDIENKNGKWVFKKINDEDDSKDESVS